MCARVAVSPGQYDFSYDSVCRTSCEYRTQSPHRRKCLFLRAQANSRWKKKKKTKKKQLFCGHVRRYGDPWPFTESLATKRVNHTPREMRIDMRGRNEQKKNAHEMRMDKNEYSVECDTLVICGQQPSTVSMRYGFIVKIIACCARPFSVIK